MLYLFLFLLLFLFIFIYLKYFKVYRIGNMNLITGELKTGKSGFSYKIALQLKRIFNEKVFIRTILLPILYSLRLIQNLFAMILHYIKCLFTFKFIKYKFKWLNYDKEKPAFISNIPVKGKYTPFTEDILMRRVRVPHKSICVLDEASLLADNMLYKDDEINEDLMMFVKLWGHYSHGGSLIINTQALSDLHFALKRCIGSYLYIYRKRRYPFFSVLSVIELKFSDDVKSGMLTQLTGDLTHNLKKIVMWNSIFKFYDPYCYSALTDDLPLYNTIVDGSKLADLKTRDIIRLRAKSLNKKKKNKK